MLENLCIKSSYCWSVFLTLPLTNSHEFPYVSKSAPYLICQKATFSSSRGLGLSTQACGTSHWCHSLQKTSHIYRLEQMSPFPLKILWKSKINTHKFIPKHINVHVFTQKFKKFLHFGGSMYVMKSDHIHPLFLPSSSPPFLSTPHILLLLMTH